MRRFTLVFALCSSLLTAAPPNVLILFSDDQGSADLSCQGSKDTQTPNIDSLAKNGVRCTQGYISSCMCSPSRAGLLTGRSQSRFGHEINWEGRDETGVRGLPVTEKTLADHLKAAGYRTGCVGKWHLGDVAKFHPKQRGFDEYFGHIGGSHDYFASKDGGKGGTYALEGWDGKPFEFANDYLTDINGRAACEFIRRSDPAKPWFLYVAFNAPHTPTQATEKYLQRFAHIADEQRRTYAAMVSALDDAVGAILTELRSRGAEDNTLIFFLSDNGGPLDRNSSLNTPLSGEKGHMLEGGIRTPYLVQWKAELPAGKVYEQPVSSLDIAATAIEAATESRTGFQPVQNELKTRSPLDGVDLIPFFKGEKTGRPHDVLYWRMTARGIWAIRMGDWKLVTHNGWHDLPAAKPRPRLIHLAADPGELHDLSEKEPAKLAELQNAYDAWAATLPEPLWSTDVSPEAAKARLERGKRQKMKKAE
ncbi:MAG: sulfatase-like hydrolase/transferase [Prosthecobacter sp.]|jgi:arylsulfatase A-like enzyme|uniref:sulfatase family protein n=1 Tax=Prosthecobacter sp. TaxID=1965333 RepID=UPI0019E0D169|nr:sulfatase-like hydrolase/transferase [Prosthecobacter sp.]MBE2282873.1 sulfatase-like hydrolase/transferase [Prosthecobacter sp.]